MTKHLLSTYVLIYPPCILTASSVRADRMRRLFLAARVPVITYL